MPRLAVLLLLLFYFLPGCGDKTEQLPDPPDTRTLAGTWGGVWAPAHLQWLTLAPDGAFFFRHGDWYWGPWEWAGRGRWQQVGERLVLAVEREGGGYEPWRNAEGTFAGKVEEDGSLRVACFCNRRGEPEREPSSAEWFTLVRTGFPSGQPIPRPDNEGRGMPPDR